MPRGCGLNPFRPVFLKWTLSSLTLATSMVENKDVSDKSRVEWPIMYGQLQLSRIPRDCLKHFEISVPRRIRFFITEEKIIRTTTFYTFYTFR